MTKFKIYESDIIYVIPEKLKRKDIIKVLDNHSRRILQYEGLTMIEIKKMKKKSLISLLDRIVETYHEWGYGIYLCEKNEIKNEMLHLDLKYCESQKKRINIIKAYLKTA
jgi:hypothetical protein